MIVVDKIILSPSGLNLFLECPKCFWLQEVRKIHRPRGPFPSLPGGMDMAIKSYFDKFRGEGTLPPFIKFPGRLVEENLIKEWRNNRKGIRWFDSESEATLMGALDDCLVDGDYYIPIDYKTRGWLVKEDSHTYYQNQLDCYTLLLEKNGFQHKNLAYLIFWSPKEVKENNLVSFEVEPVKVETNTETALKTFRSAVKTLRGPIPKHHSACLFCSWGNDFVNFE